MSFQIVGILVHLGLLALAIEAAIGRVGRPWLAVPILAYGAYYVEFARERAFTLPAAVADLQSRNVQSVAFDPLAEELLTQDIAASALLAAYDLPIVYNRSRTQGGAIVALSLVSPDNCDKAANTNKPQAGSYIVTDSRFHRLRFCMFRQSVSPEVVRPGLSIVRESEYRSPAAERVVRPVTRFVRDGQEVGRYFEESISLLVPVPTVFAGCTFLDSRPAWGCGVNLGRDIVQLDGLAAPPDTTGVINRTMPFTQDVEILGALLRLQPRSEAQLAVLGWRYP